MNFRFATQNDPAAIVSLFTSVFARSEGEAEGALIGQLARNLLAQTEESDLACFVAAEAEQILGAIAFSRLTFDPAIAAFILAPVAVRSDRQGQGIGQALIRYGLAELKHQGVSLVLTYGDPAFYSKVGFQAISPEQIIPPFALSQPEGWLGQSLSEAAIATYSGRCTCVAALSDPQYW
ncbi:GNAT family N-acetyltransferase [Leptolyngbya iicbica]|uniref:N-acetyltransferase n=2 Tax=Cyanophyceae TaxID=3028117 RepID=A0A4Q7E2K2_9CYAN|nr:N-acetyltransferase [Leptolyngbya sp. LK]RZM75484.1 N-acetyltransferase [Leptolyngbya sp. LK]